MADQALHRRSDADLEAALRDLGEAIAWPAAAPVTGGPDLAAVVRVRLESSGAAPSTATPAGRRWAWRPARRALVLAVVILLALAAVAAATGFGLPGLRLIFGEPPPSVSPPPSLAPSRSPAAGAPGSSMGLGRLVTLADLDAVAGFDVTWPADPSIGPPDAAWVDDRKGGQVTLVWASRPDLPDTLERGVGLVQTTFRGTIGSGTINKVISGATRAVPVDVDGHHGWWITGDPHFIFYEGPDGQVADERRWVGDALLWPDGAISHRLETALGQAASIAIAETLP